jgi:hypothetical protein
MNVFIIQIDYVKNHAKKMFIFITQTLQNKWNEICKKQVAGGKHMENDYFPRTLKFEMDTMICRWRP